ncbi:MAG: polymer-forming cytoskeletal protein [Pyrinomonadaceae bacterium]
MIRMGRGSRSEQTDDTNSYQNHIPEPPPSPSYQQAVETGTVTRPVTDSESMARDIKEGRLSGFVGHGTTLTGETAFQSMLRVDGHLIGTVSSESGTLIVGTNGKVDANVSVSAAVVNGTVNGDISATERIQLGRTAVVIGNIQTPRLTIEDGAVLEGGCTMLKAREVVEKKVVELEAQQYKASEIASYEAAADDDEADALLVASETEDEDGEEDESEDKSDAATV